MLKGKKPPYTLIDHTADLGCDVFGATRKDLFRRAARALFDMISPCSSIAEREERLIDVHGADFDDLWINYLRELLNLFNGTGFLVHAVDIPQLGPKRLAIIAKGEPFDPQHHEIMNEIKDVTYHQARVTRTEVGWEGRFIVDV